MRSLPPRRTFGLGFALLTSILALFPALNRRAIAAVSSIAETDPGTAPISSAEAKQRIADLRHQIAHADELYFQRAAPEISDAAYDRLKRELAQLETAFPLAAHSIAPLPPLADDRQKGFPRHRHRAPMLSLDKAYTETEVRAFIDRAIARLSAADLNFVIEPKFDGLALSATYEKGELTRAVTRGDGREGDDVTANAFAIRHLPRHLRAVAADGTQNPIPDFIELRGEVYLRLSEFQRINREQEAAGEPLFAQPRNLAAGTLKQHDPRDVAARPLDVVFYGMGAVSPASALPATQQELHRLIHAWGLPGVDDLIVAATADEVWTAIQRMDTARRRFDFPIDGVVVKLDAVAAQRELGANDSAPRWALAYKFAPERAETTLLAILFQIGRTGVLTPVAEFAPVTLGGVTLRRATLHNRDEIVRRDLRLGDTVIIEKAGEIIPALVGVNLGRRPAASRPFVFPTACPSCGDRLADDENSPSLRCLNRACPAQLRRRLIHFSSKSGVNIKGLGPASLDEWIAKGWVKDIPDLYRLTSLAPEADAKGAAPARRLLLAIEASKHAELWRFISGLGIPQVGAATAREMARHIDTLDEFSALAAETLAPGEGAPAGFSVATAESIGKFFRDPQNRTMLRELAALGVRPVNSFRRAAASPSVELKSTAE